MVAGTKRVHRLADAGEIVGNDAHFRKADAVVVQPRRQLRDILVLRPARKDLVADHNESGSPGFCVFDHHTSGDFARPNAYLGSMTQYITVAPDDRLEPKNGIIKLHGP